MQPIAAKGLGRVYIMSRRRWRVQYPESLDERTKGWLTYQAGYPFAYMLIRVLFKVWFCSASIITTRPVLEGYEPFSAALGMIPGP